MDVSRLWIPSCLIALAILTLRPASAILPESQEPIALDATSAEFDGQQSRLVFRNIRITQGPLTISADQAIVNDLDFANNTWLFTGNVNIDGGPTRIRSEAASLLFVEHQLATASVTGNPATFERDAVGDRRAISGGAGLIEYDARESTLVLEKRAQLFDGANEINGERLLYKVAEDRLIASSDRENGERVRITITPQSLQDEDDDEDDPVTDADATPAPDVPPADTESPAGGDEDGVR